MTGQPACLSGQEGPLWILDRIRAIRELSDATARRVRAELLKIHSHGCAGAIVASM